MTREAMRMHEALMAHAAAQMLRERKSREGGPGAKSSTRTAPRRRGGAQHDQQHDQQHHEQHQHPHRRENRQALKQTPAVSNGAASVAVTLTGTYQSGFFEGFTTSAACEHGACLTHGYPVYLAVGGSRGRHPLIVQHSRTAHE